MKRKYLRAGILSSLAGGLVLVSGCTVETRGGAVVTAPSVEVQAPSVEVDASVGVPDVYVWDGVENVGVVGGVYFYLGPGDVWLRADDARLARFHGWERGHPDWRAHAIRNERFRKDEHGRVQPRGRVEPRKGEPREQPKRKEEKKEEERR